MPNLTDNLASLTADDYGTLDAADLAQPYDDDPDVSGTEVDKTKRLPDDLTHFHTPTARTFTDFRANPAAFRHVARLPGPGESLHGVICGRYALWDQVPAILERTGQVIEHLHVATLSFSQRNAAEMLELLDSAKIKRLSLLVSHYFKSTSREIYDALVPQLLERRQRVLAMRSHCKLLLIHLADGTRYVCESSANLRSSVNVEQFVLTNCPDLYNFHHKWLDGELMGGGR